MYKLSVSDRDYSIWSIDPSPSITLFTSPIDHKLFDGDTFDLHPQFQLFESPLRQAQDIPGILLLENNRSYGRTDNKKRLLYRCKPFNTSYPHFLIPYEIPMGFFKNFRNKYVTFRFDHWFDKHSPFGFDQRHPKNVSTVVLGHRRQRHIHYTASENAENLLTFRVLEKTQRQY